MYAFDLPTGNQEVAVLTYGPADAQHYGLPGWSLKGLQQPSDIPSQRKLVNRLGEELRGLGVFDAFAPNIAPASAVIVEQEDLTTHLQLGGNLQLHRNQCIPADGVLIEKDQAFVGSFAGCPVIIATADDSMIVAHAARDSLLDRSAVYGTCSRKYASVVYAIIGAFQELGASESDIDMTLLFSIPAEEFEHSPDHPKYGRYNYNLMLFIESRYPGGIVRKEGKICLDLENVFIEQARRSGITRARAFCSLAGYADLAHTAATHDRNLYIIKRTT